MSSHQRNDFKILKGHENRGVKFLKATELNRHFTINQENVSFSDFMQKLPNCGLIAALATLSQRSEFLEEIAPKIEQTSEGVKLHFNMFCEGKPVTVTIDDALPFDENSSLVCARSSQNENLYLASVFEKAFIKQACNKSYEYAIETRALFAFSTFSNCITCYCIWEKDETKLNVIDYIKLEVDNKSSVTLGFFPGLTYESDAEVEFGHAYSVMDYNQEHKAVKLYDPRCNPEFCVSNQKLPLSLTMNSDANKGELWIAMDQLEKRHVSMSCLHSKDMYNSDFQIKGKIRGYHYLFTEVCKVVVKETSTFMINFRSSYSHELDHFRLLVRTDDDQRRKVKFNCNLPYKTYIFSGLRKGEAKTEYFHRFKLQPNNYVFRIMLELEDDLNENEVNFLMKIGSTESCRFEKLINQD